MQPMLATPRKPSELNDPIGHEGWIADHKLDGLRCVVLWNEGRITLTNRNQVDITNQFPDVDHFLTTELAGLQPCTLDGELVAGDGVFTSIATRGKQVKAADIAASMRRFPARFVAFDICTYGRSSLLGMALRDRRKMLTELCTATQIEMVVTNNDPTGLFALVKSAGLEGIIMKDPSGTYVPGQRSKGWIKVKTVQRVTCIAVGYESGQGARSAFGAMNLVMLSGKEVVSVGRVGTGFTQADIRELKALIDAGTPVVVEIECLNRTAADQLRFPVYIGRRTDLSVADATVAQLANLPRS